MNIKFLSILIIFLSTFPSIAGAHGEALDETTTTTAVNYILVASVVSGSLVIISIFHKSRSESLKMGLFIGIAVPILIATAYLAISTIQLNLSSETKGPVHWHADYQIWNCGRLIDLVDPSGLSNRVGTTALHEHGDNRIHIEGVVMKKSDFNLHEFFESLGGSLTSDTLEVPSNDGMIVSKNGNVCNGKVGNVQVFLYKIINPQSIKNWVYVQEKLESFEDYLISPHSTVPPGDCLIIEFGEGKNRTTHMCESYELAIKRGELTGG